MPLLQPTILLTAYALNPYKGSEDGTGWNLLMQAAREYNAIVFTRENNRQGIERFLSESDDSRLQRIQFIYFDLPKWSRWWKRGPRFSTVYFYLWQLGVARKARQIKLKFDIAHALNFHSDSHPNFLWMLDKPLVWGPVGHHPPIPRDFVLGEGGILEFLADRGRYLVKLFSRRFDPFYRLAVRRADRILAVHTEVGKAMYADSDKVIHFPAVGAKMQNESRNQSGGFTVLSAGRLVTMKGFEFSIRSFAQFIQNIPEAERSDTCLRIVGSGPKEMHLRSVAKELGVENNVIFRGWITHSDMADEFSAADVFLFPSHEGAGMVIPEALSYGLPVICLDNAGPGSLVDNSCAIRISDSDYGLAVVHCGEGLMQLHSDQSFRLDLSMGARKYFAAKHEWNAKGDQLLSLYSEILSGVQKLAS